MHAVAQKRKTLKRPNWSRSVSRAREYLVSERGFFWPDVLAVVDSPGRVGDDGRDRFGRPKWIVAGRTADDLEIELVCAIATDDRGRLTVFITLY